MMAMHEDLDEVLALKASAKSARADSEWESAIEDLEDAVGILRSRVSHVSSATRKVFMSELADTFGMIGGIHRRWALSLQGSSRRDHLEKSLAAYDKGFVNERDLPASDVSTYNRINRLVALALLDPNVLDQGNPEWSSVEIELRQGESIVEEQLGSARQKDPWGYCDLGMIRLLLGSDDALQPFYELDRLRPPVFVYESTLDTLLPLTEVASEIRPALSDAVMVLQRLVRYAN